MFEVMVPTPTRNSLAEYGSHREAQECPAEPMAGLSGQVSHARVAAFNHLQGHLILCNSGHLWVTIENDLEDHVVEPNHYLYIPTGGKVLIGGNGVYTI
jgi:hypothetical protein